MKKISIFFLIFIILISCSSQYKSTFTDKNLDHILNYHNFEKNEKKIISIENDENVLKQNLLKEIYQLNYSKQNMDISIIVFKFKDPFAALDDSAITFKENYKYSISNTSKFTKSTTSGAVSIIIFSELSNEVELENVYRSLTKDLDTILKFKTHHFSFVCITPELSRPKLVGGAGEFWIPSSDLL